MRPILIILLLLASFACDRKGDRVIVAASTKQPSEPQPTSTSPQGADSKINQPIPEDCPAPNPPPSSIAQPWIELEEVDSDLAIGRIKFTEESFKNIWIWPVQADKPTKFGNRRPSQYGYPGGGFDRPNWSLGYEGDSIGVYARHGEWYLIHSKSEGWIWFLLRDEELLGGLEKDRWSFYDECWRNELVRIQNPHPRKEADGTSLYVSIDKIQPMPGEILRDRPEEGGQDLGPVVGRFLKMTSISGDWVQVQEETQSSYNPSQPTKSGFLAISWNQKRIGWIRWRVPGPVPGSYHVRLRGLEHYGYEK